MIKRHPSYSAHFLITLVVFEINKADWETDAALLLYIFSSWLLTLYVSTHLWHKTVPVKTLITVIKVLFIHQLMHQWVVLKNNIKIYIKTAPTCFGAVTPSSGSALIRVY